MNIFIIIYMQLISMNFKLIQKYAVFFRNSRFMITYCQLKTRISCIYEIKESMQNNNDKILWQCNSKKWSNDKINAYY